MITPKVRYVQDQPKPIWLDIDGVHFPLTDELAFVYRWSCTYNGEEATNRELYPYIMTARSEWLKKREAVTAPQQITAQTLG